MYECFFWNHIELYHIIDNQSFDTWKSKIKPMVVTNLQYNLENER